MIYLIHIPNNSNGPYIVCNGLDEALDLLFICEQLNIEVTKIEVNSFYNYKMSVLKLN